jgi:hypothetical protein
MTHAGTSSEPPTGDALKALSHRLVMKADDILTHWTRLREKHLLGQQKKQRKFELRSSSDFLVLHDCAVALETLGVGDGTTTIDNMVKLLKQVGVYTFNNGAEVVRLDRRQKLSWVHHFQYLSLHAGAPRSEGKKGRNDLQCY